MIARLKRALATASTLGVLAACGQNPQFRMNMADQTYTALNELYVLLAMAELGTLRSSASFAAKADTYAAIIGGFQVGMLIAAGRPLDPASDLPDDLDKTIPRCVDQIRRMSSLHRTSGISPDSPALENVRASCDAAARSVAANEVSSWVFTTIAGDL
jgi:hypothetical protein